jgi:hypothetical protein
MKTDIISRSILVRMWNISDKICRENQDTHFKFSHSLAKIMVKNIGQPGKPQMTIWRMSFACWIPKATDTYSEYVVLSPVAFPLQQYLHERASILRYTYIASIDSFLLFYFSSSYQWGGERAIVVRISTRYELDGPGFETRCRREISHTRPARLRGPPSLSCNGFQDFLGGKVAGAWPWPSTSLQHRG